MKHFVLSVIKTEGIPCRMLTAVTLIEILARVARKIAQSFYFILHRV